MRAFYLKLSALIFCLGAFASAHAQSRPPGWEFRADLVYQNQWDVLTDHGSWLEFDTNWGGSLGAGYRFNPYAEVHFMLDFQSINYSARVQNANNATQIGINSDVDIYTPRVVGQFNFLDHYITPFVSVAAGWSSVHADVPNSYQTVGCWWDPWWGYICAQQGTSYSNSRFEYDLGVGVRWDISPNFGMRFSYEKHWIDLSGEAGTPNLDQFRIGFQFGY